MAEPTPPSSVAKRKKLFVYADAFGMSREERIDLAQNILRRDITTWKSLDDAQVDRMLDALEGAVLIMHLVGSRSPV